MKPGRLGAKTLKIFCLAACGNRCQRAAMKSTFEGQNVDPFFIATVAK